MTGKKKTLLSDDPRHGKASSYSNWGCRCPLCTKAWAEYKKKRRHESEHVRQVHNRANLASYHRRKKREEGESGDGGESDR